MPVDKNAVLGNGNTPQPKATGPNGTPPPLGEAALAALTQQTAGTLRSAISSMGQLADSLEHQRDLVTDHAADRVAAILDPQSIQAEIAIKTLERMGGKQFRPFEVEPIELPELRPYAPRLPQGLVYTSPSPPLSSSPATASNPRTTCNGNLPTAPQKGFGPVAAH